MKKIKLHISLIYAITIFSICFIGSVQSYGQDSADTTKKHKFMISGYFGLHNYYMEQKDPSNAPGPVRSKKAIFKTNFGLLLSESFIIGIGTGVTYYKNYPYKRYIGYHSHFQGDNDIKYATCLIDNRKDLEISIFIRYNKYISKNFGFFIEWSSGINRNLTVNNKEAVCHNTIRPGDLPEFKDIKSENDAFDDEFKDIKKEVYTRLSSGLMLKISNAISLETEIINFKYEAVYLDTFTEPFTKFELQSILSNPNIGLVFYF